MEVRVILHDEALADMFFIELRDGLNDEELGRAILRALSEALAKFSFRHRYLPKYAIVMDSDWAIFFNLEEGLITTAARTKEVSDRLDRALRANLDLTLYNEIPNR